MNFVLCTMIEGSCWQQWLMIKWYFQTRQHNWYINKFYNKIRKSFLRFVVTYLSKTVYQKIFDWLMVKKFQKIMGVIKKILIAKLWLVIQISETNQNSGKSDFQLVVNLWKYSVTAWKVYVFGVFLVRIFPHFDWIRRDTETSKYSVRIRENAD